MVKPCVQVGTDAIVEAEGFDRFSDPLFAEAGGEIRLGATSGNLTLAGTFLVRGGAGLGGVIEGTAAGDLFAGGHFECAPGGCIGLSAGGALDLTGGSFDKPVAPDCPGP